MNRTVDVIAAGAFALSTLAVTVFTQTGELWRDPDIVQLDDDVFGWHALGAPGNRVATDMIGAISQPSNIVLWSLLIAVLVATALHIATRLAANRISPTDRWMQNVGLLLAAAWPWCINTLPLAGLVLAAGACLLLVFGITPRPVGPNGKGIGELPVAFIAGWVIAAACSALGMLIHHRLDLGFERGILISLFISALLGAWAQLHLESNVTFSFALIWAMTGFAAATAGASITIATACVLGIAALVVVIVRVTT